MQQYIYIESENFQKIFNDKSNASRFFYTQQPQTYYKLEFLKGNMKAICDTLLPWPLPRTKSLRYRGLSFQTLIPFIENVQQRGRDRHVNVSFDWFFEKTKISDGRCIRETSELNEHRKERTSRSIIFEQIHSSAVLINSLSLFQ